MEHVEKTLKLITESLAIEAEDARSAGAVGFLARALVQATMPHRKPTGTHFQRSNGAFKLTMTALDPDVGLPYGSVPRLLLAWVTTEAVRKKDRTILLGDNLSGFMGELGMVPTGGRWGSITRLREQVARLFSAAISCQFAGVDQNQRRQSAANMVLADTYSLWWDPRRPAQGDLFRSTLVLSQPFFDEIVRSPVPIDMRALRALSKSPLSLDIYAWLTFRNSYLKKRTSIPWPALALQFGSEYKLVRQFKAHFADQIKKVLHVYPGARAEVSDQGLILYPSPTHVERLK